MALAAVALVSMPWNSVFLPSIQVGTLSAVLQRAGVPTTSHSFNLEWAQYVTTLGERGPVAPLLEYTRIGDDLYRFGLGDWIFKSDVDRDHAIAYESYLRRSGVSGVWIARAKYLKNHTPDFIAACASEVLAIGGIKYVGFTSSFSQNMASLALARQLKLLQPKLCIIFGGSNCEGEMGEELLRTHDEIDYVVRGEGEYAFPNLLECLDLGGDTSAVFGLVGRDAAGKVRSTASADGFVALDDQPMPNYDEYFDRLGRLDIGSSVLSRVTLPVETSRGCWYGAKRHCTFCGLNGQTMTYRSREPKAAAKLIVGLVDKYRGLRVDAVDNILDMKYIDTVFAELSEQNLDLSLGFEIKANITRRQLQLMKAGGLDTIQPGIESLNTRVLDLMNKGVTAMQNIRLLKYAAELGVSVSWNLIYGFPGEDPKDYESMIALVPKLVHLQPPVLTPLWIDRFSPYFERPEDYGIVLIGPHEFYRHIYDLPAESIWKLAYFFQFRYREQRPAFNLTALRDAIDRWQDSWPVSTLELRRGGSFLQLTDKRQGFAFTTETIAGWHASLLLTCDDGATIGKIRTHLARDGFEDIGQKQVNDQINEWCDRGWMINEGNRYLSLALMKSHRNLMASATVSAASDDLVAVGETSPVSFYVRQRNANQRTNLGIPTSI